MSSQQFPVLDDEEKSNAPPLADSRNVPEWIAEMKRILARGPAGTLEVARLIWLDLAEAQLNRIIEEIEARKRLALSQLAPAS